MCVWCVRNGAFVLLRHIAGNYSDTLCVCMCGMRAVCVCLCMCMASVHGVCVCVDGVCQRFRYTQTLCGAFVCVWYVRNGAFVLLRHIEGIFSFVYLSVCRWRVFVWCVTALSFYSDTLRGICVWWCACSKLLYF